MLSRGHWDTQPCRIWTSRSSGLKGASATPPPLTDEQANDAQEQQRNVTEAEKHGAAASLLDVANDDLLGSQCRAGDHPAVVVDQRAVAGRCRLDRVAACLPGPELRGRDLLGGHLAGAVRRGVGGNEK